MKITFRVNEWPICIFLVEPGSAEINKIEVMNRRLAEDAFPKIYADPTVGDLLTLLKMYADIEDANISLSQLAERVGGKIPFIEFKQNLNVVFGK